MTPLRESVISTVTVAHETTPSGAVVAVMTIAAENPNRPAVLGPVGLANLGLALDEVAQRAAAGEIVAVIVRGTGKTFCAGADLDMMSSITDRAVAAELARQGHAVLSRLSNLGVPTVAEINGVALGGGLELALHCTYRFAAESVRAIGLPEISLGLIPGWGGATLLPRIVGCENAITVILDNPVKGNTLLTAPKALKLGVVDAVSHDDELHADVLRFVDDGVFDSRAPHLLTDNERDFVRSRVNSLSTRPANPSYAMSRLADVFDNAASVSDGFAAEDEALADTIVTNEFRNRVYAFHLTTQRARKPAGVPDVAPRDIRSIGIIGAGLMASQFATLFAERLGVRVTMTDLSQERLNSALSRIADGLNTRVERGALSVDKRDEVLANLSTTLDMRDFADADFVMEAVFEDMDVKLEVLRNAEAFVRDTCILATNTSSLSVTTMAEALSRPERLIGFHFFNPVAVMPLIEVVATHHTDPAAISSAIACAGNLSKTAVITRDLAGFVVNRLLSVFLSEVLDAVDSGLSPTAVVDALAPLRLPMDPFALIDLIGRAVTLHMIESLHEYCPDRVHVSPVLRELTVNPLSASIGADITMRSEGRGTVDNGVHDAVCAALVREIDIMLAEDVVADIKDIDLCLITGAGWPVAHGGISRYLDQVGATARVLGRSFH